MERMYFRDKNKKPSSTREDIQQVLKRVKPNFGRMGRSLSRRR